MTTGMFDAEALTHLVQRALDTSPTVPEDAHGAFLLVANEDGVKAVTAVKIHDRWTVEAVVSHGWGSKQAEIGVSVKGTF